MRPLVFFWDIENCQVPLSKSASDVVETLREKFAGGEYAEYDFIVVCDVTKERQDTVQELNASQVTVIHVNALAKNACDDKLRTAMFKFSVMVSSPGLVVLISSDVNFTQALTDLRYRCGFRTALIHNEQVAKPLVAMAHEHFLWQADIMSTVADRGPCTPKPPSSKWHKVLVRGLPEQNEYKVRDRLKQLSDNCGGRVLELDATKKTAVLGFTTLVSAERVQKRVEGADVFGKRISLAALAESGPCSSSSAGMAAEAGPSESPQLRYIGRSAVAHHFEVRLVNCAVDSSTLEKPIEEGGDLDESSIKAGNDTSDDYNMMLRNHCAESEQLKRVLGITRQDVRDKMTDQSGVAPAGPSTERHGHSPATKLRLLERFAREAAELLRSSPQCRVQLQRFGSMWCKHFNRPFRLSEFGSNRLIDLLEDAKDTLQVVATLDYDKWITLTPPLLLNALQDQIVSILRQQPFRRAPVDNLLQYYQSNFGYPLELSMFGFESIDEVLVTMDGVVEIETTDNNICMVNLIEYRHRQMLANQLLYMFIRCPERRLASWQLENEFRAEFGVDVSLEDVKNYLSDLVSVTKYDADTVYIELRPIQRLALRLRRILVTNGGELPLMELEQLYFKHYIERIELTGGNDGAKSVLGVLRMASHILYLKGRGLASCTVCINRNFLSSLKDLKPDLFIPPEVIKPKKKGQASRSSSVSRSSIFGLGEKATVKKACPSIAETGKSYTEGITMPKRGDAPEREKRNSMECDDGISAASSPLDTNGFEINAAAFVENAPKGGNVLIAGSGDLPSSARQSLPVASPAEKPMSKGRRCRLAANFEALAGL